MSSLNDILDIMKQNSTLCSMGLQPATCSTRTVLHPTIKFFFSPFDVDHEEILSQLQCSEDFKSVSSLTHPQLL